jgi:hypothetical protein
MHHENCRQLYRQLSDSNNHNLLDAKLFSYAEHLSPCPLQKKQAKVSAIISRLEGQAGAENDPCCMTVYSKTNEFAVKIT